ncbi:MAG TPA: substrate-binding domain-containing protein [Thermoanaerobaculia bacterium]|nr:substrate-binding domain-containing protein [Thermoanaerobaculia bacterium]
MALLLTLLLRFGQVSPSFVLATTTSVENSGLLRSVTAAFTRETGIEVRIIAVGSGKALRLAAAGDAQAVITHDPGAEAAFVKRHGARLYRPFLWNDFVVVGPAGDPARVRGSRSAAEAFRRIHAARARFASRNDHSGTHTREMSIWKAAGVDPKTNPRYLPLGQPMAALLRSADEIGAYTLTDRATFAQIGPRVRLTVLFEGDPALRNVYAITLPRPARGGRAAAHAAQFAAWLLSPKGRRAIEAFRLDGRQQFFWLEERPDRSGV